MNFTELYQLYADMIYGFLMFKLHDAHLAQDILQEIFLAVYQNLEKIQDIENKKAWLFTIARNKIADYFRKNSVKAQQLTPEIASSDSTEARSHLAMQEMLDQLNAVEQTIIYGLYVEGFTYQELAEILNIPLGSVKSKAYYARQKIGKWLKEEPQ